MEEAVFWGLLGVWIVGPIVAVAGVARHRGGDIPWKVIAVMASGALWLLPTGWYWLYPFSLTGFWLSLIGFLNPLWALVWWLRTRRRGKGSIPAAHTA